MESASTWEYKMLINELTQGMEQAKQLSVLLSSIPSSESWNLLQRIMSSYQKALLILKWNGPVGQSMLVAPTSGAPDSSLSVEGSPRSDDLNKTARAHQEYEYVSCRIVGQQSKCKDLMMTPLYLRSRTREHMHATWLPTWFTYLEAKENGSPFSAPPAFTCITGENQVYSLPMLSDGDHLGAYLPSFMSPGTSESNYSSVSSSQMNRFGGFQDLQHSESDTTGKFSATTSSTNSPAVGLEFLIDPANYVDELSASFISEARFDVVSLVSSALLIAPLSPKTINKLVRVSSDSAPPCSQSTLDKEVPYCTFAYIPAGIVAPTKASKK